MFKTCVGGIIGLLLAIKYKDLFRDMIISGVNIKPEGIKKKWLTLFKIAYFFSRSKQIEMMLKEPNINPKLLRKIKTKTYITAGSRDMICLEHMKYISKQIPNCNFKVFQGETHSSYVVNSIIIGQYILDTIK